MGNNTCWKDFQLIFIRALYKESYTWQYSSTAILLIRAFQKECISYLPQIRLWGSRKYIFLYSVESIVAFDIALYIKRKLRFYIENIDDEAERFHNKFEGPVNCFEGKDAKRGYM